MFVRRIYSKTNILLPKQAYHSRKYSQSPTLFADHTAIWKNKSLKETDPETYEIIQKESRRQIEGIELIASEVLLVMIPILFHSEFCIIGSEGSFGFMPNKQIFRRLSRSKVIKLF
jgi:hypothetical protein